MQKLYLSCMRWKLRIYFHKFNESQSLAPQRPKKIGMDLTGNIRNPGIIKADMQGTIMDTMTKKGKKVKKVY